MPNEVQIQSEPMPQQVAQETKKAMGASDAANARKMRALRAELKARTIRGSDARLHGPLQPATIINFNPNALHAGGLLTERIPEFDFPGSKTRWMFERGGREHWGHYRTFTDAKYYLSTAGHEEHVDLGWAAQSLDARYMTPMEIVWHYWRMYSTEAGDAQRMGGVLIFDGDIHELDELRLKKSGGKIWVPQSFPIPETRGMIGFELRDASLEDELDKLVEMQVKYLDFRCQRAFEKANSKDEVERKNVTAVDRRWGTFGVEMGYLKEKQPWMNENANAGGTSQAIKTCPICRESTTDPDAVMCGKCQAPYDADCTVECVKRGYPVRESYIDALDPKSTQYEQVITLLRDQAQRRAQREALMKGNGKG